MITEEHQKQFNSIVDSVIEGESKTTDIDEYVEILKDELEVDEADRDLIFYRLKIGYGTYIINEANEALWAKAF